MEEVKHISETEPEEKPVFKLEEKHQEVAREIIEKHVLQRYRYKKVCKWCKGSRVSRITEEGVIIPCSRCVSIIPALEEWKEYCKGIKELKEKFT